MKKIYYLKTISYASLALMASCTSDELVKEQDGLQILMTAPDFRYALGSRTAFEITNSGAEFKWADNDTVGVFPDKGHQVDFPIMGSGGAKTALFDGGGWALKQSSSYSAYFPFIGNTYLDKKKIPVSFVNQKQVGNASTVHLGQYDYMAASANTPEQGKVKFDFKHLGSLVELSIVLPEKGDLSSVSLLADEPLFVTEGEVDLTAATPSVKATATSRRMTINVKDLATETDKATVKVYLMMAPVDLNGRTINVEAYNNGIKRKGTLLGRNFEAGNAYQVDVTLEGQKPITDAYHVAKAGTLADVIGVENKFKITKLKITGELNGTDIRFLREMAGCSPYYGGAPQPPTEGKLAYLDIYGAKIVEGGDAYDDWGDYTHSNVIGSSMFTSSAVLEEVVLPKDITSIDSYAFAMCQKLRNITIPDGVIAILNNVFSDCTSLVDIKLPNSIKEIGGSAFNNCTSLEKITLPDKLKTLEYGIFRGCNYLASVILPEGLTTIGNEAFYECASLNSFMIPKTVTSILDQAFCGCTKLQTVNIPAFVTTLGGAVFANCSDLTTATLEEGLKTAGEYTFANCQSLTKVELPQSITSLGNGLFLNCSNLSDVNLHSSITSIGNQTFEGCTKLTSMKLHDGIKSIGDGAFGRCSGLTSIVLHDGITSLGQGAFHDCIGLTSVQLPSTLKEIPGSLFYGCTGLTDITLPENVTSIGESAFSGCVGIQKVELPKKLTSIGMASFAECRSLSVISIPSDVIVLGERAFRNCSSLETFAIPEKITSISYELLFGCRNLRSIIIPKGIISIGARSFASCAKLETIDIPETVTSIEEGAFGYCTALTSIVLPQCITEIANQLFYNCYNLSSFTIPKKIESIGYSAFHGCNKLTEISIPDKVASIGNNAFWSYNLKTIKIEEQRTSLFEQMLCSASNCEILYLPKTLKDIRVGSLPEKLRELYCPALEPPTLYPNSNLNRNCKIYVPQQSVQKYRMAEGWKEFASNITAIKEPDAGGSGHDFPWGEI